MDSRQDILVDHPLKLATKLSNLQLARGLYMLCTFTCSCVPLSLTLPQCCALIACTVRSVITPAFFFLTPSLPQQLCLHSPLLLLLLAVGDMSVVLWDPPM